MKRQKIWKARAIKTSPKEQHIHATRFLKGQLYEIRKIDGIEDRVLVEGKFGNSFGGYEKKENSVDVEECREYLRYVNKNTRF